MLISEISQIREIFAKCRLSAELNIFKIPARNAFYHSNKSKLKTFRSKWTSTKACLAVIEFFEKLFPNISILTDSTMGEKKEVALKNSLTIQ